MNKNPFIKVAIACSIALHVGLVLFLVVGTMLTEHKEKPKPKLASSKPVVQAAIVNSSDVQKQLQILKDKKSDAKKAQKVRDDKLKREKKRIKDLERLRKKRQAEKLAADRAAKKSKAEAAKQKKITDAAIKKSKAKQAAEEIKANKAASERIKQEKAAADAKAKRIKDEKAAKKKAQKRRLDKLRREKVAKERAEQEALLAKQMADEAEEISRGDQRRVLSEIEKYTALIISAIQRHWNVDESMKGKQCVLQIKLAPSGVVFDVKALSGDRIVCKSAQDAIYKANVLPVSKDPAVYAKMKEINLTVQPEFD